MRQRQQGGFHVLDCKYVLLGYLYFFFNPIDLGIIPNSICQKVIIYVCPSVYLGGINGRYELNLIWDPLS